MKAMKQIFITLSLVAVGFVVVAETAKEAKPKLTSEQRARAVLARTGGTVIEPNTGKGFAAIVNMQTKVGVADIEAALDGIRKDQYYEFKIVGADAETKGAALTIRLIDDAAKPPMLAAPEASWAEVNVANLVPDLSNENARKKFAVVRARKMILRAFAYAAGAGGSGFSGNIFAIAELRDLDYCDESIPVDTFSNIVKHLKKRGLEPMHATSYRFACEEGWAPAPTNDIQKAIYDEIKNPETRWDKDFGGKGK